MSNLSAPIWQVPQRESEPAIGTLISNSGWPSSQAMTLEREPLKIQRLTLFAVVVAAVCCVVAMTGFIVQQSPATKSAPVGSAAKVDELPAAHHQLHPVRTIPIIGRTIPLEAQPAPPSASVTPQEQQLPPKPDPAQGSRTERAAASDPVCGERGRRWFTDRPGHRSWRCNR